jgi:acetyltransferase-like isoleucine patch superfamily enzyme
MLLDRWKKAKLLKCGEGTSIYQHSLVFGDVNVGKNVWIGPYTIIDGSGGLEIGDGCDISAGVHIYTHATVRRCVSKRVYNKVDKKPVKIGNYVFIGANATILAGVKIGDHSIIGAGAVVNKDIPPYSIAVGVPAKIVGKVKIKNGKIRFVYKRGKR